MSRVIVIGAGMAGLSAAISLLHGGVDVIVLESRNRIGGRICKGDGFDVPVDLGASWIHGILENPLADLATKLSLKVDISHNPCLTTESYFRIFDSDGKEFDQAQEKRVREYFDLLNKESKDLIQKLPNDSSLGELYNSFSNSYPNFSNFSPKEVQFLNWLKAGIEGWENCSLSQLSARGHFGEDTSYFQGGDGFVVDGYFNLVNHLAKELMDSNRILLSHIVKRVQYDGQQVLVETDHAKFVGDYVLCTVPLGVLKSKSIEFDPPLPPWKQLSIDRIGFGLMNKIILEFDELFWNPNDSGIGYVSEDPNQFNFFLNMWNLLRKPILICFVTAETARKIERFTDNEVASRVLKVLEKICSTINKRPLPRLVRCLVTRWLEDPFARGSYSFLSVGSDRSDIASLARPINEKVFFAGEATFDSIGYAHGAYASGQRESKSILSILANKNSSTPDPFKLPSYSIADHCAGTALECLNPVRNLHCKEV